MKTVTLQIGNSDDKLTQKEWSRFTQEVGSAVSQFAAQIHFSGSSGTCAPWQNAAWVFAIEPLNDTELKAVVTYLRAEYRQDSAAWTEGETLFV